ncbi:MAG: type II secretion system protein [Alphaproteobacteria bacterium]
MKNHTPSESGFTLVELAVVMVIIGLLVGGVLKGQQLIENAQITRTIRDVNSYIAAHHGFYDKYRAFAGDMWNATTRLSGCTGTNFCSGGDGNSRVGDAMPEMSVYNSNALAENSQFWKHLALADMINGIDTSVDTSNKNNFAWGGSHPAAKVAGGFDVMYISSNSTELEPGANFVITGVAGRASPYLPPSVAYQIDAKMDDGKPNTGSVRAEYTGTDCDDDPTNSYRPDSMGGTCFVFFGAR